MSIFDFLLVLLEFLDKRSERKARSAEQERAAKQDHQKSDVVINIIIDSNNH